MGVEKGAEVEGYDFSFGEGLFPGKKDVLLMPAACIVALVYFVMGWLSKLISTRQPSQTQKAV